MQNTSKIIAMLLAVILLLSCFGTSALADTKVKYVNLGDSVAVGNLENESAFIGYSRELDSYSGLFASYLGTSRINYARRGMQTTDVLYMIDPEFKAGVDNGEILTDTWGYEGEYPPNDGNSLQKVHNDLATANYITLCVGNCDYVSYPDALYSSQVESIGDIDASVAVLKAMFEAGKLDADTFNALTHVLSQYGLKALATVNHIIGMVDGYADYAKYYPQIVSYLRETNQSATIILLGAYLPTESLTLLRESTAGNSAIFYLNRLLDKSNWIVKTAAAENGCIYVDTMGVDSMWHPTVNGHKQIFDRIVSVLNGDKTYAGNVDTTNAVVQTVKTAFGDNLGFISAVTRFIKNLHITLNSLFKTNN